ncbi:uncharacterized protein LOC127245447 [Andrographis paniculata]|uniref:uncharacterized protein LOC127245447 n=1 Tax=Andrographis paniculata TaxID=175694 RepID=UPI0021E99E92|nr:uncharacterized protein LOC127245447 [Andrographis paniculata]
MAATSFPLRWESTGDQWWFASPIDWAAANGHYDVVRELLHIDTNLLINLTSLPRIRRLETVWDDVDFKFRDVAKCRAEVAYKLLQECQNKKGYNSLIRAGYGGWLLYTAASAGDLVFVEELLDREPFLVFGEGEYGVTDVFYAAARGRNSEVFRLLLNCAMAPKGCGKEMSPEFRSDMICRAVHAAARGGNVAVLKELLAGNGGVLEYRDCYGSNALHSAAGRGQVEVVEYLVAEYDIINSRDNHGDTAIHVAAYRGHSSIVKALVSASAGSLVSSTNNYGETLLHTVVSGFGAPGFRRIDRLKALVRELVDGTFASVEEIVNIRNRDGRTALHMAVIDNIQSDVVELLMSVRFIDLNICDADGFTPLDLLRQRPPSASSEILIKRLISAGGISDCRDRRARNAFVSHLKTRRGVGRSPGTSFDIPDAEIFLHAGIEDHHPGRYSSDSTSIDYSGEIAVETSTPKYKKLGSINSTTRLLKNILSWPRKSDKRSNAIDANNDSSSIESYRSSSGSKPGLVSLRQQFCRASSLPSNKRISSFPGNLPSPSTKKKFAAGLSQGVLRVEPRAAHLLGSPSSAFSESTLSSPKEAGIARDHRKTKLRPRSLNLRLMNSYLCFGAHGLSVDAPVDLSAPSPAPALRQRRQDLGASVDAAQ